MQGDKTKNVIVELTFGFSLELLGYISLLEKEKKFILAKQLLKSGTSIGANVHEAQNAESKIDFIHKMKTACKEADETDYWLSLCRYANDYPDPGILTEKCSVIIKVLSKIIGSAKRSM